MVSAYDITYNASYSRRRGIRIPVQNENGDWVSQYPITLFNEADQELGVVENPDELLRMWNDDVVNQAVGRLELDVEGTYFWLIGNHGVTPRGYVLGAYTPQGEFSDDFSFDFNT